MSSRKPALGLWTATSLVTGNMIGSGVFLLPASLALYGGISVGGWIISALGALTLAYVFANLAKNVSGSGGPYVYCRNEFGDFIGFLVAWGYWICVIAANAAIAIALVSYLSVFIPTLAENALLGAAATLSFLWILVLVNVASVEKAGKVQLSTTIIKVLPLLAIALWGASQFNVAYLEPFNRTDDSTFAAISATAALTMWAFLGMESANVPADEIENPKRNIPRAAIMGTLITACIYIPSTTVILGLIEPEQLSQSNAPFAEAAQIIWGDWAYYLMAGIAVISCFGALNGWTLCVGQIAMSAAKDKLFPAMFAKQSKQGTPVTAIVISTIMVSIFVMMNYNERLVNQFTFVILLSTLATVLPYLLCSIVNLLTMLRKKQPMFKTIMHCVISIMASVFSAWIIINTGKQTILWGCVLLVCGVPFYVFVRMKSKAALQKA